VLALWLAIFESCSLFGTFLLFMIIFFLTAVNRHSELFYDLLNVENNRKNERKLSCKSLKKVNRSSDRSDFILSRNFLS
jgi:hypothetical protein